MSTAVGNVLLNISTGKTDFASIKGFVDLMGQAIRVVADFAKKNDAYVDAMQKMSVSVDKAVQASGNLIETQKLMAATAKLSMAGIKVTEDQFKAIAVAAADMGEITGDAAGALDQLIQGIISGNERGLKPYGIALGEATTRTEKQSAAVKGLTEKFGSMEVKADTATDSFEALGNAMDDLIGTIWAEINEKGGGINSFFSDLSGTISSFAANVRNLGLIKGSLLQFFEFPGVRTMLGLVYGKNEAQLDEMYGNLYAEGKNAKVVAENDARIAEADRLYAMGGLPDKPEKKGKGGGGGAKEKKTTMSPYQISEIQEQLGLNGGGPGDAYADVLMLDKSKGPLPFEQLQEDQEKFVDESRKYWDMWALSIDYAMEKDLNFATQFRESWEAALKGVTAASLTANGAQQALRGTMQQVWEAAILGNKITVNSVAQMLRGVALSIAVEASVRAIMETALGIAAQARTEGIPNGASIAHFAAAASMFATAVIAGTVAAGANFIARSAGGNGSYDSAPPALRDKSLDGVDGTNKSQWSPGAPSGSSAGQGNQQITVSFEGDAEGMFKVVQKGSRRSRANGSQGFSEA